MLSEQNHKSLDSLLNLIPSLKKDVKGILLTFPTENYPLDKFYLIGIIERYWTNIEALEILLQHLKNKFHLEHPIGLILMNAIHIL